MKPIRIQRQRSKGWKMPADTAYVGRPSRWGNPYYVGDPSETLERSPDYACENAAQAVRRYAEMLMPYTHKTGRLDDFYLSMANIKDIVAELRGKNLACWCPLDQPCHADVLLQIANEAIHD